MQSEKVNWVAVILCALLLIVGAIGGFATGRGVQGKSYRGALETVAKLEGRVRELSEELAASRESYARVAREVEYLRETNSDDIERIIRLGKQVADLLRDNLALANELGTLELELNTIRGDISGVAGEISDVIKAAESD